MTVRRRVSGISTYPSLCKTELHYSILPSPNGPFSQLNAVSFYTITHNACSLRTPQVTTPLKRCPAKIKRWPARKICFPAKFEFKPLSPPCLCCFPVENVPSPSKIFHVPLQIIAKGFYSPSRYLQSPLKMYSFIISPLYF